MALWLRKLRVQVGGAGFLDVSDLNAEFIVRQADSQHPNTCHVRIYNLADQTSQLGMMKEFMKLTVEAGYQNDRFGPIFVGEVIQKKKGKLLNGTDKYFDISAQSGSQAYGYATVSKTLKAGHTFKEIVEECTKAMEKMGIEIGHIADLGSQKFPRASVLHGMAKDILRDVGFATNTSWSIQNQKFQMIKNDGFLPGAAKELNGNTGMIGLPEQTLKGIVVKTLVDSGMKVGSQIHLNNSSIQLATAHPQTRDETAAGTIQKNKELTPEIAADGIYKVYRVDHDGQTQGQEWYTTLTCLSLNDNSVGGAQTIKESAFAGDFRGPGSNVDDQWGGGSGGGAP
jgi:hypothetical protein